MDVVLSFLPPLSYVAINKLLPSLGFSFLIDNMKKVDLFKIPSSYSILLGFQMVTGDDKILCQLIIILCI